MIEVDRLYRRFGEVVAVDGVTFTARDGSITGLLGPNGAGKTSTLRMITTLVKPDRGTVRIDGVDAGVDPIGVRRRLGVLPDARGLYPRLTSREHIRYFGRLHGLGGAELEKRIDDLLVQLDLSSIADRRTQGFSQGERVKVALARALVHQPANVLLDEPTNGLDVLATRATRDLIRKLRDAGKCVIFSSHLMPEVAELCDHVVIIAHGQVRAEGTVEELRLRSGEANLEDAFVKLIAPGAAP